MKTLVKIGLNVLLPIIIGGIIYTLFRSETIKLFSWYKYFGLNNIISNLRVRVSEYIFYIPKWVIFSLPDGLWVYSFTSALILFWNNEQSKLIIWLSIPFVMGIIIEILQGFNFFPGTFDLIDLMLSLIAFYSSIKFLKIKNIKNEYEI
jgi:hypothetical protein